MFTSLFQLEQKPVTVFSSSDKSAPNLTAEPGSLKTILKACLVTGYGDKASLGWQMPFETDDNLSAVFVSNDPTSSKAFFKIDNSSTNIVKLSAYQDMTDIDTGTRPIAVDNEYDLTECNWKLIGHSKLFVLLMDRGSIGAYPLLFGDFPRQVRRAQPLAVFWTTISSSRTCGSVQSTLFYNTNGHEKNNYDGISRASCYPFRFNNGQNWGNLTSNHCRFDYSSNVPALGLYEYVLSALPDSTWTFNPVFQLLSSPLSDVANLGQINDATIKATTGRYQGLVNADVAIQTDWWYA